MMKVLFLSRDISGIHTGASIVTSRNYELLKDTFGEENVLVKTIPAIDSMLKMLYLTCRQYLGGLTPQLEQEVIEMIKERQIEVIAIDNSQLGRMAKLIKQSFPSCRVIAFYHNTEYLYFKSLLKTTGKLWHQLSVQAAFNNEKLLATYADESVTLNGRDAEDIGAIYKHKTTLVLPVTYVDRFDEGKELHAGDESIALFVGTLFFPNYQGIKWFINEVLPEVNCRLIIVGKGFEEKRKELSSDKVEVAGTVEDIDPYYYNASFVVAPIFTGSGMKTKTAEALMFGRTIIGTQEAFEGYNLDTEKIGALCRNKEEFVQAINIFLSKKNESHLNASSRQYFLNNLTYSSSLNKFRKHILQRNYPI
jgi:hypothetical protein